MAKKNLKIKTSKSKSQRTFLGKTYKSILEKTMAMCLYEQDLPVLYEEKTFVLFDRMISDTPSYKRSVNGKGVFKNRMGRNLRDIKYTPDFTDFPEYIGKKGSFIIEAKGYPTPEFNFRYKLFERYVTKHIPEVTLYMPRTAEDCIKTAKMIKENYVYRR